MHSHDEREQGFAHKQADRIDDSPAVHSLSVDSTVSSHL